MVVYINLLNFIFVVFVYGLVFITCLIVFIIFSWAVHYFYIMNIINFDPCLCTIQCLALIFNIVTRLVFASGFSCTTNNSPYLFNVIWIFELYNLIWFYTSVGYGWFFLLPIGVSSIRRSLLLLSSSSLDDSVLLTTLFCVVLAIYSFYLFVLCFRMFTF